jgi:hypothetical protein
MASGAAGARRDTTEETMSSNGAAQQLGRQVEQQARDAARQASPWLVAFGRFGYTAKGVMYVLIGLLAVQVVLRRGGAMTDQQGALVHVAQVPFGRVLLLVLALGIAGYALWRFLQAACDTEHKGSDMGGILARLIYAGIGAFHVSLVVGALNLLRTGSAPKNSSVAAQDWTARFLGKPFGQWLVAIAGLLVIGGGCYQGYKAFKAKFREELHLAEMGATTERWVVALGRVGFAARGVVFGLIGVFLVYAGLRANPGEARGIDSTLATLAAQPFGPWLLGFVALGFVAYGLFLFAEACYRRMVLG